jgi:two-component system sensor histidine kinase/response regulator
VVLMDCQLPEMDGFTATREIRRLADRAAQVPIIAMTANALHGDRERCLAAGMNDYLAKPVVPADLDRALNRWVAHALGERDVRGDNAESTHQGDRTNGASGDATGADDASNGTESVNEDGTSEAPILDAAELLDRIDGDTQLLSDLIALFLHDCPHWLTALRAAIAERDHDTLYRTAHTIKGSVGNFAGKVAFEAARRLEALSERDDLAGGEDACSVLETELARLKEALLSLQETTAAVS